jgi:hypothetical protein
VSRYIGGNDIRVYGVGLDFVSKMTLADRSLQFSEVVRTSAADSNETATVLATVRARSGLDLTELHMVRFLTPALVAVRNFTNLTSGSDTISASGLAGGPEEQDEYALLVNPPNAYKTLRISVRLPGLPTVQQLNYTRLVFYTSSECIDPGIWKDDGQGGCLPCPAGGTWSVNCRDASCVRAAASAAHVAHRRCCIFSHLFVVSSCIVCCSVLVVVASGHCRVFGPGVNMLVPSNAWWQRHVRVTWVPLAST